MGKNIKSYATTQQSIFLRKREGSLTAKSPNLSAKIWYGLTIHICFFVLNLQAKVFKFTFFLLAKFPANYTNFMQFTPNPANDAKFAPFIDPLYIMFSDA